LKAYLKQTAIALELERLPIRDFQEFRAHLSNRFGFTRIFKHSNAQAPLNRTKIAWLRAIDTAMARVASAKFRDVLSKTPQISAPVREAVLRLAEELVRTESQSQNVSFRLSGLARRVADDVMAVEFRSRENIIRERMRRESFSSRVELEKMLSQVREEEERGTMPPLVRRLLGLLLAYDLYKDAVRLESFPSIVKQAFGNPTNTRVIDEIDRSVVELRTLIGPEEGEPSLTDADMVALISSAAMIADGYEYSDSQSHLFQIRRNTAVFIDEVQDFTEIEVFLMGMTALTSYNQITLSGDRCQQLQLSGSKDYHDLFPSVPRSGRNKSIFLDRNLRQRAELAALSAGFRSMLQISTPNEPATGAASTAALYSYKSRDEMVPLILSRIKSVSENAMVAVIVPTAREAREWYDLLGDELATIHRPASLSRRDDLTRRYYVHFAEVYETKGLEFDVVVVPDFGSFALDTEIGCNQAYVAISRPRHALLLGCDTKQVDRKAILKLIERKFIRSAEIPTSFL
jgi:hypothetical protein